MKKTLQMIGLCLLAAVIITLLWIGQPVDKKCPHWDYENPTLCIGLE